MKAALGEYQFAGFRALDRLRADWVASPFHGEGRVRVFFGFQNPSPQSSPLAEGERRERLAS
jgi:hypothetical protein